VTIEDDFNTNRNIEDDFSAQVKALGTSTAKEKLNYF